MSGDQAATNLTTAVSKLRALKLKLEEHNEIETLQLQRFRTRLDHLGTASVGNLKEWNDMKLKRILVDYFLHLCDIAFATELAETYNIQDLVDIDVFLEAKEIIDFLHNKEIPPALAWCEENRLRLNKFKSRFEFHLRRQEFIELLRIDNLSLAVDHARIYLAPWGATFREELEHVMGAFAFSGNTECETYKVLFEEKQWDYLVEEFKREFYRLYGITTESLLDIHLQAGLTVLRTLSCYEGNCPNKDPFSQAGFRKLAEQLPFSNHRSSKLICYISKQPMDYDNPPLVLPNGYAYSTMALCRAVGNEGEITCPRTGDVYHLSELVTAQIEL
ncbi:macrophage erythroblast attacher-like [Asparagus officinalis]|uniref:macrophage erythroblast attacher-like n=1 Tax=Asparagus officinalis TaxID=4686 RepID=UPI00098E72D5|nr:macrophage erythroblast attacher-like [Asparagus officinalis]